MKESRVVEGQGKAKSPNLKIHVLYLEPGQRGLQCGGGTNIY